MAFESAHYQLTRCLSENVSASTIANLAVKRFQRRFFVKSVNKINPQKVVIGGISLRRTLLIDSEELGIPRLEPTVYKSSSFSIQGQIYFCHTDDCKFPSRSCFHSGFFEYDGETFVGQILACYSYAQACETFLLIRKYPITSSFAEEVAYSTENYSLRSALLEYSSTFEAEISFFDHKSSEIVISKPNELRCPCVFFKTGLNFVASRLIYDYEHD